MTDVTLVRKYEPIFPNRCIRCDADPYGLTVLYHGRTSGWWYGNVFPQRGPAFVRVPSCSICQHQLIMQRRFRFVVYLLSFIIGLGLSIPLVMLGKVSRGTINCAMIILVFAILPFVIWDFLDPKPFEMTVEDALINYEFRDARYAMDFRELNFKYLGGSL
jgi:hypothetical protein